MRVAGVPISSHIYHAAMQTCCNQMTISCVVHATVRGTSTLDRKTPFQLLQRSRISRASGAAAAAGQAAKALELFKMMREGAGGGSLHQSDAPTNGDSPLGVWVPHPSAPDKYCYDMAISACRRLKKLPQALELLDEMQSFGEQFAPSAYTYNEIIRAC
eukprot:7632-Heterococcus_DN1.PRE.1